MDSQSFRELERKVESLQRDMKDKQSHGDGCGSFISIVLLLMIPVAICYQEFDKWKKNTDARIQILERHIAQQKATE
jgi:hypothetical protein